MVVGKLCRKRVAELCCLPAEILHLAPFVISGWETTKFEAKFQLTIHHDQEAQQPSKPSAHQAKEATKSTEGNCQPICWLKQ